MDIKVLESVMNAMTTRQLQREAARAISTMLATNQGIAKFNKEAQHNSHLWYKAVIKEYVEKHGDLPSKTGPGVDVKLIMND
jgi:hypothetical protein